MMREIEVLENSWRADAKFRRLRASPTLEKDGLHLGSTRLLATRKDGGDLAFDGAEARVLTLLAVAYGYPIDVSALAAIRRAEKHARSGNDAMAAMHLALAGLSTLVEPADAARRLFIADGLLEAGIRPHDIFAALAFDSAPLDALEKFNPDEPRVPKGSGRASGQWTHNGSSGQTSFLGTVGAAAEELLPEVKSAAGAAASRVVPALAGAAARLAPAAAAAVTPEVVAAVGAALAAVGGVLIPTPRRSLTTEGAVEGRPDLRYSWDADTGDLTILRASDNQEILRARLSSDGKLIVGPKLVVGRKKGDKVEIYPFPLPLGQPNPNPDKRDEPRLCPKETPDRPGGNKEVKDRAREFEDFMKLLVNPDDPTPSGYGYAFFNPKTGRDVIVDDCQHHTGNIYEFKGTGYAEQLKKPDKFPWLGTFAKMVDQAKRQAQASQGRRVIWVFAEEEAADYVSRQFAVLAEEPKYKELEHIEIYTMPWHEGIR